MLSTPAQPDYELDDFTAVSEWERFTANVEECLREWAAASSGAFSPSTTASTQQQLASNWPLWLVRACDLGSVGGQRFELVRHWHESINERPSSQNDKTASATSDGTIFLDLLDSRCDFDLMPNPDPYKLFGFRDFALVRIRQNSNSSASSSSSFLSIQLSNLLLSSLASAATAASCSMPMMLEMPSAQAGSSTGRIGYTGISVSRVAVIDLNATLYNPPSRPPTHLSTQATAHLCYWLAVMRNHLRCPLWPQPPLQLSVRYSYFIKVAFPQLDLLSPVNSAGRSLPEEDDEDESISEEIVDSEDEYEDGFVHSGRGDRRHRMRRRRSSGASSISGESICANFCRLPCGIYDPVEAALEVILTWPCLDDSHFTDSPIVSSCSSLDMVPSVSSCRGCTLDPSTAIDWLAKLWLEKQDQGGSKHGMTHSRCLLTDFVSGFSKMAGLSSASSSSSSLATSADATASPAKGGTGSSGGGSSASHHWSMRLVRQIATATATAAAAALPPPNLLPDLVRLLVDAWVFPKSDESQSTSNTTTGNIVEVDVRDLKAAPPDSLVERVAIAACALSAAFGQTAAVQFWQIVSGRFQALWEAGRPLARVDSAIPPDLKQSLIAQKVQLLAYCLGQRLRREREVTTASSAYTSSFTESSPITSSNDQPKSDGRLRVLDAQKTMLVSGKDVIYVPETQEPEPMTEDELPMFPIDSEVEPASGVGFQHSIPCLLSDMCSFKAANPGATLIDFLRWYSPRDVQDDATGTPALSSRMCIPDNIWQTTWAKATATPARRQKRLFDETRAAHNVLRWFSGLANSPRDLTLHLLPVVLGAALRRLIRESKTVLPSSAAAQHIPTSRFVKEAVDTATEAVIRATSALSTYALARASGTDGSGRSTPAMDYEVGGTSPATAASNSLAIAIDAINVAEQRISLMSALRARLSGAISAGDGPVLEEFLFTLVASCSTNNNGIPFPASTKSPTLRSVILSLMSSEGLSPVSVSTVIRANCPRPAAFSRSLPHRLSVRFHPSNPTPSCSHLAAAFARDVVFA